MEECKQYLQKVAAACDLFDESTTDSDSDMDGVQSTSTTDEKSIPNINKKRSDRLPTRRPDPNVYNRNALLARENRRKKKAHLETMERELEEAKNINRTLLKALKKQLKKVKKLTQEKSYYKSIVLNQPDIQSLVAALSNSLPLKSMPNIDMKQQAPCKSAAQSPTGSWPSSGSSTSSSSDIFEQAPPSSVLNSSENDFEQFTSFDSSFTELLVDQDECATMTAANGNDYQSTLGSDVTTPTAEKCYSETFGTFAEHNYVSTSQRSDKSNDNVGICLHIGQGKVTLEFCPTCHWNASRTPPQELLQNTA